MSCRHTLLHACRCGNFGCVFCSTGTRCQHAVLSTVWRTRGFVVNDVFVHDLMVFVCLRGASSLCFVLSSAEGVLLVGHVVRTTNVCRNGCSSTQTVVFWAVSDSKSPPRTPASHPFLHCFEVCLVRLRFATHTFSAQHFLGYVHHGQTPPAHILMLPGCQRPWNSIFVAMP